LGTGAGKPSGRRNVSSLVLNLVDEAGEYWLFDCGEATQHQMMRTSVTPHRIRRIFVTHLHGDHVFGLPGLLTSRSMTVNAPPLDIYGPIGMKELVETVLRLTQSYVTYDLHVHEIESGVIFEKERFKVLAGELEHRVKCFGFRIEEEDRPGKLDMEKLGAEGILPGPVLQQLKNGEVVLLEDGRRVNGADYVGAPVAGKVVTILGDTQPCVHARELAFRADVLVHEATFEAVMTEQARLRGHSTTRQAAQIAKDSGVKQLILTHMSQRYSEVDELFLLQECWDIFGATKIAHDFDCIEIL